MTTTNDLIRDQLIRHEVYLGRYSRKQAEDLIELLESSEREILQKILRTKGTVSKARLNALLETIRKINVEAYAAAGKAMKQGMFKFAQQELTFNSGVMNNALRFGWNWVQPSSEQLRFLVEDTPFDGRLMREWVASLADAKFKRMSSEIRRGYLLGESVDNIARRIQGPLDLSRAQAHAVARTATNAISNGSRMMLYRENADIVKGVQWMATLDGRTTAICRGLDTLVWDMEGKPIGHGHQLDGPPAHVNCRSVIIPVLRSYQELGFGQTNPIYTFRPTNSLLVSVEKFNQLLRRELAADNRQLWLRMTAKERQAVVKREAQIRLGEMTGKVSEKTSYSTWLRSQSVAFQDEVLGRAAADIFRRNLQLNLSQFIDRSGKALTLEQLALLDKVPAARATAGLQADLKRRLEELPRTDSAGAPVPSGRFVEPSTRSIEDDLKRGLIREELDEIVSDHGGSKFLRQLQNQPSARKELTIANLVSLKTALERARLFELARIAGRGSEWWTDPVVIRLRGVDYIFDGDHRIAVASVRGQKKMQVRLIVVR